MHRRHFNSQPPEGGWTGTQNVRTTATDFNSQPPEGGWLDSAAIPETQEGISTHSRPKAAGAA